MIKFFLVAVFLLFNIKVFSQNFTIKDSQSDEILPFVTILWDNGGTYSDGNGVFQVPKELNEKDEIDISFLGYEEKKLLKKNLKEEVFLKPKVEELESIIIDSDRKKIIEIKKRRAKKSTIITKHLELVSFILPKKYPNTYLKQGTFYFDKTSGIKNKSEYDNLTAVVRINFYSIKDEKIKSKIFASKTFKLNLLEKESIEINFEKSNLSFNENGFAIGLEFVETINEEGNLVDKNYLLRPMVAKKENPIYTIKSFQRFTLKNNKSLNPLQIYLDTIPSSV